MPPRMTVTFRTKAYNQGQTIFKEGQDGSFACIIHSGKVAVVKDLAGEKVTLAVLKKGAVFGEMALVADERRTATVVALEYTEVVIVDRHRLNQALEQAVPLVQALVRGLVERLAHTSAMVRKQYDRAAKLESFVRLLQAWLDSSPVDPEGVAYIPIPKLMELCQEVLHLPSYEVEALLRELRQDEVVQVSRSSKGRALVLDRPQHLAAEAGAVVKRLAREQSEEEVDEEVKKAAGPGLDDAFINLYDLAQETGVAVEDILQALAQGRAPESMVLLNREEALAWVREHQGRAAQPAAESPPAESPPKRKPSPALETLLAADKPVLQRALVAVGYDQVLVLAAGASPKARKIILANLGPGVVRQLEAELPSAPPPPPDDFSQAVGSLASQINRLQD